jgi:hypothetical protein
MPAQLELDLAKPAARPQGRALALALFRGALLWTPVWVPLVFLGQLVVLGLRPTLAESERLDRAEAEVRARADALAAEERELADDARRLSDEVYRERVRRSLLDPASEPLTLERARAERP